MCAKQAGIAGLALRLVAAYLWTGSGFESRAIHLLGRTNFGEFQHGGYDRIRLGIIVKYWLWRAEIEISR